VLNEPWKSGSLFNYLVAGPGLFDGDDRIIMSFSMDGSMNTFAVDVNIARRFADDILRAANYIDPLCDEPEEEDINVCPNCGGPTDNGFSREIPPSPYLCTKCEVKYENRNV
jgi:hypothetical protein